MITDKVKKIFGKLDESVERISKAVETKMEGKLESATIFAMDKISKGTDALINFLDKDKKEK